MRCDEVAGPPAGRRAGQSGAAAKEPVLHGPAALRGNRPARDARLLAARRME